MLRTMRRQASLSLNFPLALALFGAPACSTGPDETPVVQLLVRTDKAVYSVAADDAARTTLVNQGSRSIYAPMNEYVYVQRLLNGWWGEPQPWFVVDGVGMSFPVAPGDSLVALPMGFAYVGDRPGIYRFIFEVALDPEGRRLVPEPLRVSPPFELRP
jgi:hypothetical protein